LIDPVYALPTDIVQTLNLQGQIMKSERGNSDARLNHYDVL